MEEKDFELTPEVFKKILSEKSMEFTLQEIEQIMDEEVEKPLDEMDCELIDMCAQILVDAYARIEKRQKRLRLIKKTVPKIVAVAASLCVCIFGASTVGAKLNANDLKNSIIEFCSEHFKINLNKEEEYGNDWVNSIVEQHINERKLPQALLSNEYTKSVDVLQEENSTVIYVNFYQDKEIYSVAYITEFANQEQGMSIEDEKISNSFRNYKMIDANGLEVHIFGTNDNSLINYIADGAFYEISINCNFDEAVEIAKTII